MSHLQEVTLCVPDVSCEHCVQSIKHALEALAGIKTAQTDLATKTVHIQYDAATISLQQIAGALGNAGYPVAS